MKVLFFPYWPANPYQPNLMKALEAQGATAAGVKDTSFVTLAESAMGQDVLHLHWSYPYLIGPNFVSSLEMTFQFFKILIRQKFKGSKFIWTIHNLGEHEHKHPRFELFCHRLLARFADGIIVHSRFAQEKTLEAYWLRHHSEKVRIIPHGNYIGNYPNEVPQETARNRLGIEGEKRVFLFLGQIRPYKGLPELVAAFNKVATGNEILIMAGKPLNERIKANIGALIADRPDIIYLPKFVPDEEIQTYMNAADVVVFPFRDIFTSGSVLLAMSFTKALIVPDLESLAEITAAGGSITYEPQDQAGLEKALAAAIHTDLAELGQINLAEAQRLSWEAIGGTTLQLYDKALGR